MKTLQHTLLFFTIIIIEGYIVLSNELLVIRQSIPYIGSGTDTVSIIIAAVLMPLAFGYQNGGRFKPRKIFGKYVSIREKLILNIIIASTILLIGMSYRPMTYFFVHLMGDMNIDNRLIQITLYCLAFVVIPVYLLGQTVPLISNYFSKEKLSKITGRILFFSTVGSFLGAVFSTIVLMSSLGVHHTVTLNFVLLSILVILLSKNKFSKAVIYSVLISCLAMIFNSDILLSRYRIVSNNEYNRVQIISSEGNRLLFLNRNASSSYNDKGEKHKYIEFAERIAIEPIINSPVPKEILIIGSGGFTFGHHDDNNHYTFVDLDEDLKGIAEKYILKEPIGDNKTFIPKPARAFLNETDKKFDVIYLDAYLGGVSIPEHLVTQEFFLQVKSHLKDNAILMSNMILSPSFNNTFSRNIDNTFRSVFPHVSRHVIPHPNKEEEKNSDMYFLWDDSETRIVNVAYIYRHQDDYEHGHIYTDDKNTVFYDKPKSMKP